MIIKSTPIISIKKVKFINKLHFMFKMDVIDKKILCELDLNCRTPYSLMAKRLRVSRNVVAYRIKNLEQQGVITNYICSLNLGLLGYKTFKINLKTVSHAELEKKCVQYLLEQNKIIHALKTEGAYDYTIAVAVHNVQELDSFLMQLKQQFKDFIKDYSVSIVVYTKVFKLHKLLLGEKKELPKIEKYSGEEKEISLDEKDRKILVALSQEANLSLLTLVKKTGLSLDIVKYRLKQLSKSIITSFRITFDLNKINYYFYRISLKIRQATKAEEEKLIAWCSWKQQVLYCTKRIGQFDFELNLAIKDINEFNLVLAELKQEFGAIIESYETVMISQLIKLNYVPF